MGDCTLQVNNIFCVTSVLSDLPAVKQIKSSSIFFFFFLLGSFLSSVSEFINAFCRLHFVYSDLVNLHTCGST